MTAKHFRKPPAIVSETLDGEVILINMDDGSYFSMENTAAMIWCCLESGASVDFTTEAIARHYPEHRKQIEADARWFVELLLREGLVVPRQVSASFEPPLEQSISLNGEYGQPELHKYTDMEDLLTLDPIHEVDDSGWPNVRGS